MLALDPLLRSLRIALATACLCALAWSARQVGLGAARIVWVPGAELAAPPAPAAGSGPADYAVIAARDLFRSAPRLHAPPIADAVPSSLPLRLVGTVALVPAERSVAVVIDPADRTTRVLRIGEFIRDARVVEIQPKVVFVERGGQIERLAILQQPLGREAGEPRRPRPAPAARAHARDRLASALQAASAREAARAARAAAGPGPAAALPGAPDPEDP